MFYKASSCVSKSNKWNLYELSTHHVRIEGVNLQRTNFTIKFLKLSDQEAQVHSKF